MRFLKDLYEVLMCIVKRMLKDFQRSSSIFHNSFMDRQGYSKDFQGLLCSFRRS